MPMNWCDLRPALSAATRYVLWEAEHPVRSEAYCEPLKASALTNFWWDPGNYQVCGRNLTRRRMSRLWRMQTSSLKDKI